ncbi:MAG: ATP-binding cassette domain-containing protein [Ekhidna sp.]
MEKKKATERIEELLLLFDLKKNEKSKIRELSSGNKMKVSFISSLIHNPSILILDEPFTNLDIKTIDTISKVLRDLKGLKTILISSHNLDIIYKLCDRFIVIHEGNISLDSKDHVNDDSLKSKITTSLSNSSKLPNPSWLK